MKYCTHCGAQIGDFDMFCSTCGAATGVNQQPQQGGMPAYPMPQPTVGTVSDIKLIAKVFMLLGCILMGIWLIPLAWGVPMTVVYWSRIKNHQHVGVGFKVCTLLFVSLIAGILMLCDNTPD